MFRSESNQELLHLPHHSAPRMITEFSVPHMGGAAGGLIAVESYGDYVISIGSITMGIMGCTWKDKEKAIEVLCDTVHTCSEKCTATDIQIGGCSILLFVSNAADLHKVDVRHALLDALAMELQRLVNTNVLCLPGSGITTEDMEYLFHSKKKDTEVSFVDEVKTDDDYKDSPAVNPHRRGRSRSLSVASEVFDYPVPEEFVKNQSIVTEFGAYSALGSIETLIKDRKWRRPKLLLAGYTPISHFLYGLLESNGVHVTMSDPDESWTDTNTPAVSADRKRTIPWDQVPFFHCDILVPCTPTFFKLEHSFIQTLCCNNILSISNNILPKDHRAREALHLMFEECKIFDFCDGLCDLGAYAKLFHLSQKSSFTTTNSYEMGARIMRKSLHLAKIVQQYDKEDKHNFYKIVLHRMEENSSDDLNLGLGTMLGNSSENMTQWMWARAKRMCPAFRSLESTKTINKNKHVHYVDLGSGTGSAARWICKQNPNIHFKCINICPKQNAENRQLSDEAGLGGQVDVETMTFERMPSEYSNAFDGCIAQDSFFHAYSKAKAFNQAFMVTKGGGWIIVSDLMSGEADNVSHEELATFKEKNNIKTWFSPSQSVDIARKAGWADVQFIDCTAEIKISIKSLLDHVKSIIDSGRMKGLDLKLLQADRINLVNRMGQVDRGVFKWGIIAARKPYDVVFMSEPPMTPDSSNSMMKYSTNMLDGDLKFGTDVIILNIGDKMPREAIMNLPSTVRLIVTMSAGLDHICMDAASERGIRVRRAARDQIVKSVADYLLSNIIFGLRNGFQNVGVPFPGKTWNLSWNADGVDLDRSKIGFIGMGAIAIETARRLRALSTDCEMVFHIPDGIRCHFEEGTFQVNHVGIADLYSTCDVVIPMVPLTPTTTKLVDYAAFTMMKNNALFVNMARGKVVDTDGLTRALEEGIIKHAILDTTDPEPLPKEHPLWTLPNCTITPHFATNTVYVREELVEDIPNQVEDTLEERGILRLEEQKMRKELSEAYRITREFGMDELVWNHISVLLSDGTFLITPGNRMFDDISPQDLVKSSGNITADIIHDAIYQARPDVRAIVHLHTPATVAVSCLEMGFQPYAQEAAPFVGRVASHPWHGLSNDWQEQKQLGEAVADSRINTLVMENHGFCTFGKTLGEAWVLAYYFDKACQTQLSCLQAGVKIRHPDPTVLAHAAEQAILPEFLPGACEWEALRKMLTRKSKRWN